MFDAVKLALIPLSILAATLVSRRFGHGIGGIVSGLPLIAGPIIALLLLDHPGSFVAPIAQATLIAVPASLAYIATFAWLSRHCRWPVCLLAAAASFFGVGWLVTLPGIPVGLAMSLGLLAPPLALWIMPRAPRLPGGVAVPGSELVFRMLFALVIGALISFGSTQMSSRIAGLLLAWPISGSILPCFTLPLYGHQATINLLRGFANGLFGFVTFFFALSWLLPTLASRWLAFLISFALALAAAALLHQLRRRQQPS